MQGSWPQYPTPETQREYAENRWHGDFPMTRSAFSAQPQQLRDEMMWIFGAESFADLVEKHPAHFYNGLGGARSRTQQTSTPSLESAVPSTPVGATGVGISAILNHGRTFITNQGHEQGTPGNPSASLLSAKTPSTESPEWEHPIVPRDERAQEESNYLEMGGDKYKSKLQQP